MPVLAALQIEFTLWLLAAGLVVGALWVLLMRAWPERLAVLVSAWVDALRSRSVMAYGRVVPADARVEPEGFDEDEFPVHCPGCGYALRGLNAPRCPECGREYDRGHLLMKQYVIDRGRRPGSRLTRAAWGLFAVGFAAYIGFPLAMLAGLAMGTSGGVLALSRVMVSGLIFATACFGVASVLFAVLHYRNRGKAKRVLAAWESQRTGERGGTGEQGNEGTRE